MTKVLALVLGLAALPATAQEREVDPTDVILHAARERMLRQNDVWFKDGEYLAIVQNQEILVGVNPTDEENWSNLAWMYMNIERADMQWLTTRRFAQEHPTYRDAKYYEAEFLYMKRAYAKIPALIEPALAAAERPDDNAYRFLAHSYNKMGYYKDALRVWDAYIAVNPSDAQAKVNRDKVAEKLKSLKP